MATPNATLTQNEYSEQEVLNKSYDKDFKTLVFQPMGYDGNQLIRQEASDIQTKIITSGDYTYICKAPVGTAVASAGWKIYRVDSAGSRMYADGDADYDNVATDPTSLTYSYT